MIILGLMLKYQQVSFTLLSRGDVTSKSAFSEELLNFYCDIIHLLKYCCCLSVGDGSGRANICVRPYNKSYKDMCTNKLEFNASA